MQVLTYDADTKKYSIAEGEMVAALLSSFTSPITGKPVTGGQAIVFGLGTFVGGMVVGKMFGNKIPFITALQEA